MNSFVEKSSTREKLSYGLLTLGNIPIMVLINSFLLIFYTDIIGLDPKAIGTLFLISRFFDAINDPIIGYILDHRKPSKGGRFRPVLMLFGIITALNFLLLWFGGVWVPAGKLIVVYFVYLLFSITFTVLDISGNSLLPVVTQHSADRDTISVIKGVCQLMGGTIVGVAAPLIIADAADQLGGYFILILGATAVIGLFTLIGAAGVKERVVVQSDESKYQVRDILKILTYKPLLVALIMYLAVGLGSSFQTNVNAFYFTYVMGDLALMGLVMGSGIIGMILSMVFAKVLLSRLGKKRVTIISAVFLTMGCLIRLIGPTNVPLQVIGGVVTNFGMGLFTATLPAMLADSVDAISAAMGFRADGVTFSLSSFVSKITMGLGGAIPGYILAYAGYQASAASQPVSVNRAIILMLLVLPAIFYVIAAFAFGIGYKNVNDQED